MLVLSSIAIVFSIPRVAQNLNYHNFSDKRIMFGIPNFGDVISNLAFFLVGILGLVFLLKIDWMEKRRRFIASYEWWVYLIFFLSLILGAIGSAYYHLKPNNLRLFWDRLPIAICSTAWFSAIIGERISIKWGARLWVLLMTMGAISVIYWEASELIGKGDVRFYAFVQFFPFIGGIALLYLFPPRYSHTKELIKAMGWVLAAKIFELADNIVFKISLGTISGHTLKHLLAAFACYVLFTYIKLRRVEE
jgi:hypothetical protein